jgi:hypothetical protein
VTTIPLVSGTVTAGERVRRAIVTGEMTASDGAEK